LKLLALDTATELCSAALWLDGVTFVREDARPRASSELILGMIEALLGEAGLTLPQLDAIAFGRGPGAFTGVRLAAAVAQGLGFALKRPLLPISDLRAVAQQALSIPDMPERVLVCQDARLRQVYWGCFECGSQRIAGADAAEAVSDPGEVRLPQAWAGRAVCAAGSGFAVYPELGSRGDLPLAAVRSALRPRALEIAVLAASDGLRTAVSPADALPVYLRDQVTAPPVGR
jgi:tRNA threonylcarbamoyladenosine biosynthesis protein TsaB